MFALSQIRKFFQGDCPAGDIIIRSVRVDWTRSPHEALEATGRLLYLNDTVIAAMPQGIGDEVAVHFFKLGRYISDDDLEEEYELRGLVPADPYSVAAVNEADPAFADDRPNGTHWKDADGKWRYAAFVRWHGGVRGVNVYRSGGKWSGYWWFAGRRK